MNKAFWLFLAAIFISFYALDKMLESPPAQRGWQVRTDSSGEAESKDEQNVQKSVGFPTASGKSRTAGKPIPQMPTNTHSQIAPGKDPRERLPPSGDIDIDNEAIDIQEIEDRVLTERLIKSSRNPAFHSRNSIQQGAPVDSEDIIETEEGAAAQEEAESPSVEELSDTGDEELPDDTVTYEPEPDEDSQEDEEQSEELIDTTEAGPPVDEEDVNSEEMEQQMRNEQMDESRKNPAYLRTLPQMQSPEETEDED